MTKHHLIIFAFVVCIGCGHNPVQPGDNRQYKIAFTYYDSVGEAIAKVNQDGSSLTPVHRLSATSFSLRWSPDGSKFAFDAYNTQLQIVNSDGSDPRTLPGTSASWGYCWSADSKKIIFSMNDSIYSTVLATGVLEVIGPGVFPALSPSGDKIACLRNSRLFVINSDGTGATHVADSLSFDGALSWSPSGDRIAFVNNRRAVCVVGRSGGEIIQVTADGNASSRSSSWSPDGKRLTYDNVYGVGVVNTDGTENKVVLVNGAFPRWSPDGSLIVCLYRQRVFLMRPDGNDTTEVAALNAMFPATWSQVPLP